MPQLTQLLTSLGLHKKQITVFGVLLERGPMFASAIARAAKLNRTTTYGILNELMEKGLVSSAKVESATRYQSIAPELLPAYIERQREALAESRKQAEQLAPQLA